MSESVREVAGLRTLIAGDPHASLALVLMHGYGMRPEDLAPFTHSIGVPLLYLLPQGPIAAAAGGFGWWVSSVEEAGLAAPAGPRDLAAFEPQGLDAARCRLQEYLAAAAAQFAPKDFVLGGFSQGAMLALDLVLRGGVRTEGLVLLSASRVVLRHWADHQARLHDLPVFVSHGHADADLAFHAGVALRDFVAGGGARVDWVPFDGGHEIPLIVWRGVRKFLRGLLACAR
jgi:phospholipase/carboxylesterase